MTWWPEAAIVVAAGFLMVFLSPLYPLGVIQDDARYLIRAQSLLEGRYAEEEFPEAPPSTIHPGYPALLAPFVATVPATSPHLKLLSIAFTLISGFFLSLLFQDWFSRPARQLLMGAFLFSPGALLMSPMILTENALLLFTLGLWLLARRGLRQPNSSPLFLAGFGILIAWTTLIRYEGAIAAGTIALGLAFERRWKWTGVTLAALILSLTVLGMLYSRNPKPMGTSLVTWWAQNVPPDQLYSTLGLHTLAMLRSFVTDLVAGPTLSALWGIPFLFLVGMGLWKCFHAKAANGLLLAMTAYALGYFLLHVLQLMNQPRYLYAGLPLALASALYGAQELMRRAKPLRVLCALYGIALGVSAGAHAVQRVKWANVPENRHALPSTTFDWVRQNTPEDAVFFAFDNAQLYLYTRRKAHSSYAEIDRDYFRYQLMTNQTSWILLTRMDVLSFNAPTRYLSESQRSARVARWVRAMPGAFELKWESPAEGTQVYRIREDARFVQAFARYLEAVTRLNHGESAAGESLLEQVLRQAPDLAPAWNAWGTSLFLKGGSPGKAETALRTALRLRPDYTQAWVNLGQFLDAQNRRGEARQAYLEAQRILSESSEGSYLKGRIADALARLIP